MELKLVVVVGIVVALGFMLLQRGGQGGSAAADAHRLVQDGAQLIDVRTPEEFAAGHISGARNIPVQQLADRMSEIKRDEHAVVVYCRSGARSANAAAMLTRAGYPAVHDLGAMGNW